jgi:hypothetical protein
VFFGILVVIACQILTNIPVDPEKRISTCDHEPNYTRCKPRQIGRQIQFTGSRMSACTST